MEFYLTKSEKKVIDLNNAGFKMIFKFRNPNGIYYQFKDTLELRLYLKNYKKNNRN